jgi:hypothetical protein
MTGNLFCFNSSHNSVRPHTFSDHIKKSVHVLIQSSVPCDILHTLTHSRLQLWVHVKDLHKLQGYLWYTSLSVILAVCAPILCKPYLTWGNTNFHSSVLSSTRSVMQYFSNFQSIVINTALSTQNYHCWHLPHDTYFTAVLPINTLFCRTTFSCVVTTSLSDWALRPHFSADRRTRWADSLLLSKVAMHVPTFMRITIMHLHITTTAGGQKFILWLGDHRKGIIVHNMKFLKSVSWTKAHKRNCHGKKHFTCHSDLTGTKSSA